MLFLIFIAILLLLINSNRSASVTNRSETPAASSTGATVTDQGAASSEPISGTEESTTGTEESISSTAGPISGTWAMYWTNSKGSESQAFTITFTGSDTGTLEILNDDTESNTTFKVKGDEVMFEFTRTFQAPIGDWPEKSRFVGILKGRNEMSGEWAREDWECWPDQDKPKIVAGCASDGKWSRYPSHLIRMSE